MAWHISGWKISCVIVLLLLVACNSTTPTPAESTLTSAYLFEDDFTDPQSGWSVFGDQETAEVGYGKDVFRIAFYQGNGFQSSWSAEQFENFSIMTLISLPAQSDAGAGLSIRASSDNWYLLMIYPQAGQYSFSKVVSGVYTSLIDHRSSDAIQPIQDNDRLQLNLKVNARDSIFEIFVGSPSGDYVLVDTIQDDSLQRGRLGLAAEPPKDDYQAPYEILFDWIRVAEVEDSALAQENLSQETVVVDQVSTPEPTEKSVTAINGNTLTWSQSNQDGFGDIRNISVFALGTFNGDLYAGTRNDQAGAEIWRLTNDTWEQVMRGGFGSTFNLAIDHLLEFHGYLYASTWNQNSDTTSLGTEIWRTRDGDNWEKVVGGGFGNPWNGESTLMQFEGLIVAGTWSFDPGQSPAEIWVSETGNQNDWVQVQDVDFSSGGNDGVITLAVYEDHLYIGTARTQGAGSLAWRMNKELQINAVDHNNFDDPENHSLTAYATFGDHLYASVGTNWDAPRQQIWRCQQCDGSDWELIRSGGYRYESTWRKGGLEVFNNQLYAIVGNQDLGLEVWRTEDGKVWEETAFGGFDDAGNIYTYCDNAIAVLGNSIFIGTDNRSSGGEVWKGSLE